MFYYNYIEQRREEPTIYGCDYDTKIKPGATFGPCIRDIYLIECCTSGYGSVIVNGREFPVKGGDCYILLPGDTVIHTADKVEPREGVSCAVDGLAVKRAISQAGITSHNPFVPQSAFEGILKEIERLLALRGRSDLGADMLRTQCIYGMLGALLEGINRTNANEIITRAVSFMETNYHSRITVDSLAKQVGLDRSYFSVLFKEHTGLSPHSYLNELRIKKACALLDAGECSVAMVAEKVGFEVSGFSRIFKRITGMTPMEYKKR